MSDSDLIGKRLEKAMEQAKAVSLELEWLNNDLLIYRPNTIYEKRTKAAMKAQKGVVRYLTRLAKDRREMFKPSKPKPFAMLHTSGLITDSRIEAKEKT